MIKAGDPAQLAPLFERHNATVFRYLYQLTRNRALSEDLTQEVFLRVLKYAASFNEHLGFRPWLYGMARNVCHDSRHKTRGETAESEMSEFQSREPLVQEVMEQQQNEKLLAEALRRLPDDKREVLELSRFHGLRYEEIGSILGCEVGAVKVRVYRALKALREQFLELSGGQTA